jgi:VanZ family protein
LARKKRFVLFAAILWTVFITYLSLAVISVPEVTTRLFKNQDKIVHFTFYFVFTLLWFGVLKQVNTSKKELLAVVIIAILYGLTMEVCQGIFTNYRNPDVWDVVANGFGSISAGIILIRFRLKKHTS